MKNTNFSLQILIFLGLLVTNLLIFSARASDSLNNLDLSDQNLSWKVLSHKDYTGADLRRINFSHAILKNTKFLNAKLSKANFQYSDLTGADLTNACLDGAKFKGAKLLGAIFDETPRAKGTLIADKKNFENILKKEQTTDRILQELTSSKFVLMLEDLPSLIEIQDDLRQHLQQAQYQKKITLQSVLGEC